LESPIGDSALIHTMHVISHAERHTIRVRRTPTPKDAADGVAVHPSAQCPTKQFVRAIYSGQPFRAVPRDLGLTSNWVWG
jgi:hypothetical protein